MNRLPIGKKTAKGRSVALSAERLVNMYAEEAPEGGKSNVVVHGCPGLTLFADLDVSGLIPSYDTIYMTRFADGTNADIGPNNTVPIEAGTGHDYASGYYNLTGSADDNYVIDMAPFYTLGQNYMMEAIVEHTSNSLFSLLPFFAMTAGGDAKEFGWNAYFGDDGRLKFDTITSGDQWSTGPTRVPVGEFHIALQAEYLTANTYEMRVYYLGELVFTENLSSPISSITIGRYSAAGDFVMKFHEVAVRRGLKYTADFTPPTTLDNP